MSLPTSRLTRHLSVLLAFFFLMLAAEAGAQQRKKPLPGHGLPPKAKRSRMTGGESFPPLPLPATPLRRTERKREPSPPVLLVKLDYANDAAKSYRHFEASGEMPAGSVLVKDSFAVTKRGDVFSGPLFVMEKMPPGFNLASRDWRYTMIMPDGSLFGSTNGEGSDRVGFCVTCHKLAGSQNDHLFYIPERYRVRFLN